MAAMAHEHHAVHPSDLEVLDAVAGGSMPQQRTSSRAQHGRTGRSSSTASSSASSTAQAQGFNGNGNVDHSSQQLHQHQQRRRPLDTLQALRRPPIDPIVLAASLTSGPQMTRHHFLHSFGPKQESKQMPRSDRVRRQQQEEEQERLAQEEEKREREEQAAHSSVQARQHASSSFTRPRAGSYANCDADDVAAQLVGELASIDESLGYRSTQAPRSVRMQQQRQLEEKKAEFRRQKEAEKAERQRQRVQGQAESSRQNNRAAAVKHDDEERPILSRLPSVQLDKELVERKAVLENATATSVASGASALSTSQQTSAMAPPLATPSMPSMSSIVRPPPLNVRCYARTRIPTPHGEIFCHLYRNNRDRKEHLALVIDPDQNSPETAAALEVGQLSSVDGFIRSRTLDEVWSPSETEMERIVRGAYVGRLSSTSQMASAPTSRKKGEVQAVPARNDRQEAPLVRIHSECYTGETIGSQRCDCGEQLDEAIRLIHADGRPAKGVVVYLRQEGRGIGLLDKLMAYNLQDMGHDTVSANILLGHLADARKYDIAAEILRDLGLHDCRLLTNNPEKIDALEAEGIRVVKRVAMVPRIWRLQDGKRRRRHRRHRTHHHGRKPLVSKTSSHGPVSRVQNTSSGMESSIISQFEDGIKSVDDGSSPALDQDTYTSDTDSDSSRDSYSEHIQRRSGATMVGASITRGPELEKYLRTKVERMGHLLDVPPEEAAKQQVTAAQYKEPALEHLADGTGHLPHSVEDESEAAMQAHPQSGIGVARNDDDVSPNDYAFDSDARDTGGVTMCATDSAPGTASDVESLRGAASEARDDAAEQSEADDADGETEDDQILVPAAQVPAQ